MMVTQYFLVLTLKLLLVDVLSADGALLVCLSELGCLQGKHMSGYQTKTFEAFLGIPYAKAPIGNLRFKNPEPFPSWLGKTLDATAAKPECLQKNYFLPGFPISGSEDCLYLNLYRPLIQNNNSLPVIFYIHGGGFFSGSANPALLGPEYFMDTNEVILVTVAYRLGAFGFLSTADESMPGNFGLKDQNLALKWLRKHVNAFGGDPESVTIAGHSAGGSAVQFHMMYDISKGLFKRAIMMSGSATAPYAAIQPHPLEQTIQLAVAAGVSNAQKLTTEELSTALRSVDATTLLNAGDVLKLWNIHPLSNFRPTIESLAWKNAFITEDPEKRIKLGNFHHIPWMTGIVSSQGEGAILTLNIIEQQQLNEDFNQNFELRLRQLLGLPPELPEDVSTMLVNMILDEYFQGIHALNNQTAKGFMELFGDVAFHYPFYKSLKNYLNYADLRTNPVYLLKFDYRGPYSYSMVTTGGSKKNFGVIHIDDLLYLFRTPLLFPKDFEKNSIDAEVVKALVGSYVEFAKNGYVADANLHKACGKQDFDASPRGICEYVSYANDGSGYKISMDSKFDKKRMQFWENILEQ